MYMYTYRVLFFYYSATLVLLNWRIIALPCCVGFCRIAVMNQPWIYICPLLLSLPPPSTPSHPSWSSPSAPSCAVSPLLPVSLAVTQAPSASRLSALLLPQVCLSASCSAHGHVSTILLDFHIHMCALLICLFLSDLLLYMAGSRFIHLTRTDSNVFLWLSFHCIYVPHLYSYVDGHLGCFHVLL